MAEDTLTERARVFNEDDAHSSGRHAQRALAITRAVALAAAAQEDRSVTLEFNSVARWYPAFEAACGEMRQARDLLMNTLDSPHVDWSTPLTLLEATEAALGQMAVGAASESASLTYWDVQLMAEVLEGCLHELAKDCAGAASTLAAKSKTAPTSGICV